MPNDLSSSPTNTTYTEICNELLLIVVHRGPIIPLSEICEQYFGIGPALAIQAAMRHRLPVPAFKLRDSKRAPFLVSCSDLAKLLEKRRLQAIER